MCGSGYVVDHCIAVFDDIRKKETAVSYIADCLKAIGKSVGVKIPKRLYDVIHPAPVDHRSAAEIAADIAAKAGLKAVKKHERI